MVTRLRLIDSILQASSLLEGRPRAIDRYIDYFGDGQTRRSDSIAAK
jgi:hypothetical protein